MLLGLQGCREAVIWMAVHHKQKKAVELFSREVAPAGTGMGESTRTHVRLSLSCSSEQHTRLGCYSCCSTTHSYTQRELAVNLAAWSHSCCEVC